MPTQVRRSPAVLAAAVTMAAAVVLSIGPWESATASSTTASPRAAAKVAAALVAKAPHVPGLKRYDGGISAATRELVVVTTSGWRSTRGTLSLYVRAVGGPWRKTYSVPARLGANGLVKAALRHQDTYTTPAGIFFITSGFGRLANPGTKLAYHRLTSDDWWVEDRLSPYYNQMRRGSQGGFALTTTGPRSSEHLAAMGTQYDYVAVIDFNRPHPVVGRGSGIFLHVNGKGSTAGCVSVPLTSMRAILRWLNPALRPIIVIGPSTWLNSKPG
ncbi:MAG TPA: L,D-transpeptidase family protein [Candidatus Nanopelagicales bacterium]|jgi:L,D-peptidoglycan transpeptidase YkuD (ErfK/YbiS/YcfS/YnhG family)